MPSERYFVDEDIESQEQITLSGSEFHHLVHVMRTRKGEHVELVNGRGSLAQATVLEIGKDKGRLFVNEVFQEQKPPCQIILAQAFTKQHRLDLILEKGTELGVDTFWLFPGQHSSKKECYPNQLERAKAVTIAAMKQCGRLYLPSVILKPPIGEWNDLDKTYSFFGDLDPEAPLFSKTWEKASASIPYLFITGPEGGFSAEEIEILKHQGAMGVKLHQNTLRAETASLMAVGLMSHWLCS